MAIRQIRMSDDPILRKVAREVQKIDKNIINIVCDMQDTLKKHNGLGMAATQIGVLKRIIVALDNHDNIIHVINPIIMCMNGSQVKPEACLSIKNISAYVERPTEIQVKGLDINNKEIIVNGTARLARILCHEIDLLDGIWFTDKIYNSNLK
jgi:peptide deformylase